LEEAVFFDPPGFYGTKEGKAELKQLLKNGDIVYRFITVVFSMDGKKALGAIEWGFTILQKDGKVNLHIPTLTGASDLQAGLVLDQAYPHGFCGENS
jgi:hypothetical protein